MDKGISEEKPTNILENLFKIRKGRKKERKTLGNL